jgi:Zn-dependent protease with chaperone function
MQNTAQATTAATKSKYPFKTMKERTLTGGSAALGLAAFGWGLSSIFNPVALGIAVAYGAYTVGGAALMSVKPFREWQMNALVKKGKAEEVSPDSRIGRIAKEVSDDLGRAAPPKIYTIGTEMVAKMALPFGLRWLAKNASFKKFLTEKAMPKVYAALPGANTMYTTKEALNSDISDKALRFIVAHEMGHLKADAASPTLLGRAFIKAAGKPLLLAVGAGLVLSAFGVGLPVTLGMGLFKAGAALIGLKMASNVSMNFGMRVLERRADRNALYVTRDLEGARETMNFLHEPGQRKPSSVLKESFLDHPSYLKRMDALTSAFNVVSKYAPLKPTNDNKAAAPKPQQKPQPLSMRGRGF